MAGGGERNKEEKIIKYKMEAETALRKHTPEVCLILGISAVGSLLNVLGLTVGIFSHMCPSYGRAVHSGGSLWAAQNLPQHNMAFNKTAVRCTPSVSDSKNMVGPTAAYCHFSTASTQIITLFNFQE